MLDVVFGPDGNFEGAPNFVGPLLDTVEQRPAYQYVMVIPGLVYDWATMTHYALDLRIPSVAARLAGLCARALDFWHVGPFDGAWGVYLGSIDDGPWGWTIGCAGWSSDYVPDVVPNADTIHSEAEFIAALTLALAPRIATLKGAS